MRRLWRSRLGATAVVVALSALPLIAAAGAAVDLTRLYLLRVRLVASADAAAVAGARAMHESDRDVQAERWFWTNFTRRSAGERTGYLGATVTQLSFGAEDDDRVLRVRATATLRTTFLHAVGTDELWTSVDQSARRQELGMELALTLDVTGSMAGAAMTSLRNSAAELVSILYGSNETIPNLWVSVVPYTATTNIGPGRTSWLAPGSYNASDWSTVGWYGCVEARSGGEDETDTPPSGAPFRPFLWRSTVGRYSPNKGDNEWSATNITAPNPANPPSDSTQNALGNGAVGPNLGCGRAILPLTQSKTAVLAEIAALRATHRGGTMANLGLQLGWATLSPRWRGLWGHASMPMDYGTPYMRKVLVLMTDGNNEWYDWPEGAPGACRTTGNPTPRPCASGYVNDGDADYTAYGRLRENRLNLASLSNANARAEINTRMARMCTRIKQAGITVYTITFNVTNTATQDMYRTCASAPENYFNSPTTTALQSAFREIGQQLANLRLVR